MNFGTAYLDGSGIYGATPESADKLREFDGGFLKVFTAFCTLCLINQIPNAGTNQSFVMKLFSVHYFQLC